MGHSLLEPSSVQEGGVRVDGGNPGVMEVAGLSGHCAKPESHRVKVSSENRGSRWGRPGEAWQADMREVHPQAWGRNGAHLSPHDCDAVNNIQVTMKNK